MITGLVLPLTALIWLVQLQASDASRAVERDLRQRTQELLDAVAPGNVDIWRRLLHDRMIHIDENGVVRTKEQLLAEFQPLPPGLEGTLRVASFDLCVHGDVAVATHEDHEELIYFGHQVLAVPADPPAISLDAKTLCAYEGTFALTPDVTATVRCRAGELTVERAGRAPAIYRPETDDVFFSPGQPRTRRIFQRDATGAVIGFVDRREGPDIVWRKIR